MPSSILVIVLSFSFMLCYGVQEPSKISPKHTFRLPNDTKPISYEIKISTNVHRNDFNFSGSVSIRLLAVNFTDKIVLHAKLITLKEISLLDLTGNTFIDGVESEYNNVTSFLTIFSKTNPLNLKPKNEYLLKIAYNATLNTRPHGFYRATHKDLDGNEIWIAATQFEPTYARQAFPCYDEPQLKASFLISITHGQNYSAISNMPADGVSTENDNGMMTTTFLETPVMPLYSVAFVVSNFEHRSVERNNITHRIFLSPGNENHGQSTLEISVTALNIFQEYFKIKYPLPKIDHIGISKSYGRAMENWGLIVYREKEVLLEYMNMESTIELAYVITHELAHQWFGNLVTLKWWTYTWLNEAIATHYGYKAMEMIYTERKISEYARSETYHDRYSQFEGLITNYVETEDEIASSFSGATYFKASRVLKMFEEAFTEPIFKEGVSLYLTKFQYSSADEDDFFQALQEAATENSVPFFMEPGNVKNALKTWTCQKFYPIVTLTRHYEKESFTLEQRSSNKQEPDLLWHIPITFISEDNSTDDTLRNMFLTTVTTMHADFASLNCTISSSEWIILNRKAVGIYRVNYDDRNWKLISEALKKNSKSIPISNRVQLIHDCAYFLVNNKLNVSVALDFLAYLEHEEDSLIWNSAISILYTIHEKTEDNIQELFKLFLNKLVYKKFMLIEREYRDNRSHQRSILHNSSFFITNNKIFKFACDVELKECLDISKTMLEETLRANITIDLDEKEMDGIILCEGLKVAGQKEFETVFNQFCSTRNKEKRTSFIECVADSKNNEHIKFLLESILNKNITYSGFERSQLIAKISLNANAMPILIEFLKDNHKDLAGITSHLWKCISYIRHLLENDIQRQAYLELLDEVKYLGTLGPHKLKKISMIEYPKFHEQQQKFVLIWLQNYQKTSSSQRSVDSIRINSTEDEIN